MDSNDEKFDRMLENLAVHHVRIEELRGQVFAIEVALHAFIATHPNPGALASQMQLAMESVKQSMPIPGVGTDMLEKSVQVTHGRLVRSAETARQMKGGTHRPS